MCFSGITLTVCDRDTEVAIVKTLPFHYFCIFRNWQIVLFWFVPSCQAVVAGWGRQIVWLISFPTNSIACKQTNRTEVTQTWKNIPLVFGAGTAKNLSSLEANLKKQGNGFPLWPTSNSSLIISLQGNH